MLVVRYFLINEQTENVKITSEKILPKMKMPTLSENKNSGITKRFRLKNKTNGGNGSISSVHRNWKIFLR